jgi:transposase-like protein
MQRPITQTITHLFLDAIYLPVRRPGFTAKQALLCAVGIAKDGTKHALGFLLGDRESADAWNALIRELLVRGLNHKALRLVISDDHKAILAAVAEQLNTPHQLCVVHKMRNALARVAAKNRKDFYADFKAVYWAQSPEDAQRALGRLEAKWGSMYPKATQIACANSEAFLRFHNEPQYLWRTLRSTNLIERFNREIRRRLNSVGTMHGENVLHKLLWCVATEQEKRWTKTKLPTVKELKKAA